MDNNKSTRLANKLFPVQEDYEIDILDIPAEKRKLNTETYDFTVSTIVDYIDKEHLDIPMFQRGYVWNRAQASRLIESLIIQCPIPVIYLSQNSDESLSVIDGNQRLTSINLYLKDGFPLTGLATYPELEGFKFSELDPRFQKHIINRTIRCIVILKDTHPQIKFDVFERLNTGSVKLNPQELRHGIYNGPLINTIDELSKGTNFKKATSTVKDKRMKGEELILRYFALHDNWINYQKPMTTYLNNYAENNRFSKQVDIDSLSLKFRDNFNKCYELYGEYTFKTFDENRKRAKANTALFDAQMISMTNLNPSIEKLENMDKKLVIDKVEELLSDDNFYSTLTKGTTDRNTVHKRISIYSKFLENLLS